MVARWALDDDIFDAPFELATEEAAALVAIDYYGVATGGWLDAWLAGFTALEDIVCCLAIPGSDNVPFFYKLSICSILFLQMAMFLSRKT